MFGLRRRLSGLDDHSSEWAGFGPYRIFSVGRTLSFEVHGNSVSVRFITFAERKKETPRKEMVLEVLRNSERTLTTREILDEIVSRYRALQDRDEGRSVQRDDLHRQGRALPAQKARASRAQARRKGIWYFTGEQLESCREHYIRSSELLRTARGLVKSEKAVPLSRGSQLSEQG